MGKIDDKIVPMACSCICEQSIGDSNYDSIITNIDCDRIHLHWAR